jgi:hypothetical protein
LLAVTGDHPIIGARVRGHTSRNSFGKIWPDRPNKNLPVCLLAEHLDELGTPNGVAHRLQPGIAIFPLLKKDLG